jgi:hypothetical protein
MKEYKDEIKRKEHQILQIKLHLKDWGPGDSPSQLIPRGEIFLNACLLD